MEETSVMLSEKISVMPSEHLRHRGAASKSKAATHGLEGRCDTAGSVTVLDRAGDNFFGEMVSAWLDLRKKCSVSTVISASLSISPCCW